MKRILMMLAALASLALAATPSPTQARTSVGISVNIGDPYRGASFRFRSAPDLVLIPATRVYYVDNYDDYYGCDVYRYGSWWYLVDDGYWYRSHSYSGPFYAVDYDYVPSVFFSFYSVPTHYRRHWAGSFAYRSGDWSWYRGRSYPASGTYYRYRDGGYAPYSSRSGWTGSRTYSRDASTRQRSWSQDRTYNRTYDQAPAPTERSWSRDRTYNQAPSRDRTYNREAAPAREQRSWSRDRTEQPSAPQQEQRSWGNRDRGQQQDGGDNGNRGNGGGRGKGGNKGGRGHGHGHDD